MREWYAWTKLLFKNNPDFKNIALGAIVAVTIHWLYDVWG